ncbi:MAG: hypothetical protein J6B04_00980 [Clostridia bacterium]|nr:hypothetical protein [Clostridia bacterium]
MAYCRTCVFFTTDDDCDGPETQYCDLNIREGGIGSWISECPACRYYVEKPYEDEID